jgi:hypothetical protein
MNNENKNCKIKNNKEALENPTANERNIEG